MEYNKTLAMQIIIITAACCLLGLTARSQTFSEWWKQKKTRLKYLREQVAALKAVEYVIRNGYKIQEEGIDNIREIDSTEFALHDEYFKSLEIVNPEVRNYPQLLQLNELHITNVNLVGQFLVECARGRWLTPDELHDFKNMFDKSLREIARNIQTISLLVTEHQLKMTDGERIMGVTLMGERIKEENRYIQFCMIAITGVIADRIKESLDIDQIKKQN